MIICSRCDFVGHVTSILEHWDAVHGGWSVRVYEVEELRRRVGGSTEFCYPVGAKNTSSWSESMSPATIRNRPPIRAQLGVLGSSLQAERGPF